MKARAARRRNILWLAISVAGLILLLDHRSASQNRRQHAPTADGARPITTAKPTAAAKARRGARYGQLPLRFEANRGQTDRAVKFIARGSSYALFLTAQEAVLRLRKETRPEPLAEQSTPQPVLSASSATAFDSRPAQHSVVRLKLAGANPEPLVAGVEPLAARSHYLLGNDPRAWQTEVANFAKVKYPSVYPGIDLVWYGNERQLEHDFIVAPGADPRRIKLELTGARRLALNEQGDLVVDADGGQMQLLKPVAWQEINGRRQQIACNYRLKPARQAGRVGQISFELGGYDRRRQLIIDPILLYSTFIGGSAGSETGRSIAVDKDGNAYVIGETSSADFPLVNPIQSELATNFGTDVFVLKLNQSGTALTYATYLGGMNTDFGNAIAVGEDGAAYVTGYTFSNNFPTTAGALQRTINIGADGFVAKLNPAGSALAYATYLGGSGFDLAASIAVNASGEAYVVGYSDSTDLPANGLQQRRSGNAIYKSIDRGSAWNAADTGLRAPFIYGLAVDPTNANIVYASASDGVYKTTDGGATWQRSGNFATTSALAIDPQNPQIIFAAANFTLYKTADGGATWQERRVATTNVSQHFTVLIDPVQPMTVYAGTDRGVFKSTNGGETWTVASNGLGPFSFPNQPPQIRVTHLVADPTNPQIIYAVTDRGLFKTLDGGALWLLAQNGLPPGSSLLALVIDPLTPTTLYVSTSFTLLRGNLYKSVDGGNSWTLSSEGLSIKSGEFDSPLTVYSLAVDPVTPTTVYAGTQTGGLFKSTDGGASWQPSNNGLNNVYIRALAIAPNSPATIYAGVFGGPDVFVAKLNAAGSGLNYLTYLGGQESDFGLGIAVDKDGHAFVTGQTNSTDFPLVGALQATKGMFGADAFVAKLNPAGTELVYATYLGGSGNDSAEEIALDAAGSAHIAGLTLSADFPLRNALQPAIAGDFDAFVAKLNPAGSALAYATYLGGSRRDAVTGLAVDGASNAYVGGSTLSDDFPVKDAAQARYGGLTDAIVAKLDANGALVYATWLGGQRDETANDLAIDANGNAYVTGTTTSPDFPTLNPLQQLRGGSDVFITKLGIEADLGLTKTAARNPAQVNNPLTYTITATNLGPSPATGVVVTDQLPDGVTFVSATAMAGSCNHNAGTVTCNLGALGVRANATITLIVTPTAVGTISNAARVQGNEPDNIQNNNQATAQTSISNLPSIAGRVTTINGQGLAGVTITLANGQTATEQTDNNGFYQFANLTSGAAYTVTPSHNDYSFEPAARSFAGLSADQTADFTATICNYAIAPTNQSFDAAGGAGTITVTATPRCAWTAVSGEAWITITAGASGAGNGAVNFTVAPTTAPRSGRITVAGQNFAVYQGVAECGAPALREAAYFLGGTFGEGSAARPVAADFNGDGRSDLIVLGKMNRATSNPFRLLTVLAGNEGGGVSTLAAIQLPSTVQEFAVGDFNGDGRPDIAALNGANVELRLSNGAGGLDAPRQFALPPLSQTVPAVPEMITGDFNRDGRTDLLLVTYLAFDRLMAVRVMLNNGASGLNAPINIALNNHIPLGVADVNADGNLDLLTYATIPSGSTTIRQLRLYPGDGAGSFSAPVNSNLEGTPGFVAALGDFNGDGKTDAALFVASDSQSSANRVALLFGDGRGGFGGQANFDLPAPTNSAYTNLLALDLNNDGRTDLLAQASGRIFFLAGDGAGRLGAAVNLGEISGLTDLITADLNADGKLDLAGVSTSGDMAHVFFNGCGAAPTISGRVALSPSSSDVTGVRVKLTGPANFMAQTETDSGGNYLFAAGLTLGADYTVTPTSAVYSFTPANRTISNLTANAMANFVAARAATVVSAANFRAGALAPESIAAIFGEGMTLQTRAATTLPLPTQLDGVSVTISDARGAERPVRLFFISPSQINVLLPPGLASGAATLTITQSNFGPPLTTIAAVQIEAVAPGLFARDGTGRGLANAVALRVRADGTQTFEPIARFDAMQQRFVAVPIELGEATDQVFLIAFGTGLRNRSTLAAVTAQIGGVAAAVTFAGAHADLPGIDQLNLRLPRQLAGRGEVEVVVTADGKTTNAVTINVK